MDMSMILPKIRDPRLVTLRRLLQQFRKVSPFGGAEGQYFTNGGCIHL